MAIIKKMNVEYLLCAELYRRYGDFKVLVILITVTPRVAGSKPGKDQYFNKDLLPYIICILYFLSFFFEEI